MEQKEKWSLEQKRDFFRYQVRAGKLTENQVRLWLRKNDSQLSLFDKAAILFYDAEMEESKPKQPTLPSPPFRPWAHILEPHRYHKGPHRPSKEVRNGKRVIDYEMPAPPKQITGEHKERDDKVR